MEVLTAVTIRKRLSYQTGPIQDVSSARRHVVFVLFPDVGSEIIRQRLSTRKTWQMRKSFLESLMGTMLSVSNKPNPREHHMIKVIGHAHQLALAKQLYQVPQSAMVDITNLTEQTIIDADRICLVGAPWDHKATLDLLKQRSSEEKAVRPDRPGELHAVLSQAFGVEPRSELAFACVYHNFWNRTWYAYPLIAAVAQAQRIGLKKLTVIEFGVWQGNGLLNLASLCEMITSCTNIEFRVVGFDTGTGLPSVKDYRDHPELWYTGELTMPDPDVLRSRLPDDCELILGDIKDTLPHFVEGLTADGPVGFVALDVDTYSSSVDALRLFEATSDHLLPVVPMYVDDSYVNITQCRFAGEALAIDEFNSQHDLRKIDHKIIVRVGRELLPWQVGAMYFAHIFDHPLRRGEGTVSLIPIQVHRL